MAYSRRILRILLLAFVGMAGLGLQAKTVNDTPIAIDPKVSIGTLPNGLTYYIRQNAKPENRVELRLVVNAGSILENDDQRGLAHFVEHMAFNGTEHFPKNELVSYLQSIGVKFGGDLNASTSFDETVYMLPIPTQNPDHVEKGFQVLADWAGGLRFDPAEIDKERGVVLEEARLGKGASDRVRRKLLPELFAGSRYAERLPIGSEQVIAEADYETIRAFYRDWYRPDLMAVVVVGDIDPARARALIEKNFGGLENPASERRRAEYPVPAMAASKSLVITDKENTSASLQLFGSGFASKPVMTLADYRQQLNRAIVFAALNQRLAEQAQQNQPPFIAAYSGIGGLVRGQEAYQGVAVIGDKGTEPALTALVLESERMRRFGVTQAELDRAKSNLGKAYEQAFNERDKTQSAAFAQAYIQHFLQQAPIPGAEFDLQYANQLLPGISLEDVNAYAARWIPDNGKTLTALIAPEKTDYPLPDATALTKQLSEAYTQPVTPYIEKAVAKQLLAQNPAPGRLLSSELIPSINLTTLTFANGTRVLLKPTDFKNDEVLLTGFRDGGTNSYPIIDSLNADFAASLDGITGLGAFTPNDLPKVLAGKSVSINAGLTASSDEFSGRASATDLESMLQLLYLQFTDVRQDPALFTAFSGKVKPLLAASGNNPNTAFADFYNRQLYADHPRSGVLPTQAQMDALSFDRAYAINREHFGNANGFTFVLVGAFDLDKAKALAIRYIGGLPSDVSKTFNAVDTGMRPIKTSRRVDFSKGSEPKSTTLLKYTGEIEHYDLAEDFKLYLLEEVLKIKLTESLREQLSGVYTVGVGSEYARQPYPNYSITLTIPSAPENVDALVAAAKKEIDTLRRQGPSPVDFAKVKQNYLTGLAIRQKENSYWLGKLAQFDENGMDPALIPDYNRKLLAAMTIGDLQQAAARYFDPQRVFEAVLKPETASP